jgi:hypothetical protein
MNIFSQPENEASDINLIMNQKIYQ